jgi:hypothetical protein
MTRRRRIGSPVLFLTLALLFPAGAEAGAYLGASLGATRVDDVDPANTFSGDSAGYKLIGGWRIVKYFGVEADWRDFGSADDRVMGSKLKAEINGLDLFAVGVIPFEHFELFAKVGYLFWDLGTSGTVVADDSGGDLAWGVGGAIKLGKFAVRFEYEGFEFEDASANMLTAGFDFRF